MRLRWLFVFLLAMSAHAAAPNVVYIIADDHTYRDFGFMGSPDALTPHLDRLAAQSARFPNGYVTTSLCSPSLGVLLTGRYPHQSGLHYNHPPPGNSAFNRMKSRAEYEQARSPAFETIRNQPTLPRTLGELGYRSFQTGKFWEGHFSNAGFTEGMTLFEPAPGQDFGGNRVLAGGDLAAHGNGDHGLKIGRQTMQPIADFIDRTAKDQPFFIWYAPYLPHQPHDSPQKYFDLHKSRGAPAHRIPYLASISQFDDTVGQLVSMIEARGLAANTLFIFVSDNGWTPDTAPDKKHPGEYSGTKRSKYSPFDDGLRTPILLRWDGVIPPATHPQPLSSVDLLPTVLDAAGKPDAIADLPGRSLLQAAKGSAALADEPVFGEIYPGDASALGQPEKDIAYRWIRQGDHKLIVPQRHGSAKPWNGYLDQPALFNVVADPQEQHNLAGDPAFQDRLQALQRQLDAWWKPTAAKKAD
jgi:arylsulfatase A